MSIFLVALTAALPVALQDAPLLRDVTVVDEVTGAPIPGAEVFGVAEAAAPVWGEFWFTASSIANARGLARLAAPTEEASYSWLVARADGYGATGRFVAGTFDGVRFEMKREQPLTIEVVDFRGRPLPLAHLGLCVGCGHTPDVATAVTGPDGRATLRGVAEYVGEPNDLYVVHPSLALKSYDSLPYADEVDGVARHVGTPGSVLEGRVVLENGSPAVGYGVGRQELHRGPWARTDERGEFRLFGAATRPGYIEVHSPGGERIAGFDGSRAGELRTLRLDGTDRPEHFIGGEHGETAWPQTKVRFQMKLAAEVGASQGVLSGKALANVPIEAWDPATGMCFRDVTGEGGNAYLTLPPGEYRVEVGGPECPYPAAELKPLSIAGIYEELPQSVACTLPSPRSIELEVTGLLEGEEVEVMLADGSVRALQVTNGAAKEPQFLVPSGPFAVHIVGFNARGYRCRRIFELPYELPNKLGLSAH